MASHAPEFKEIYAEHIWDVYAYCAYRVLSRADAEDLTQLTFERALRAFSRYDPAKGKPLTWLLAIAHNVVVDHHRRGPSRRELPAADVHEDDSAAGAYTIGDAVLGTDAELESALNELSEQQRDVLALRFAAELSGPEVAELLGLSVDNVHQITSRALRQLRAELESSRRA